MRLVNTLEILDPKDLIDEKGQQIWIPAAKKAEISGVTVATIYDRIKKNELQARNFEGRIFVKK